MYGCVEGMIIGLLNSLLCIINEAIVFGDGFEHATEPYPESDNLRVMLSLTFGTDKSEYWNTLKQTIDHQSNYMILPCGHEKGTCQCFSV